VFLFVLASRLQFVVLLWRVLQGIGNVLFERRRKTHQFFVGPLESLSSSLSQNNRDSHSVELALMTFRMTGPLFQLRKKAG
jgi:hypothetical protein